MPHWIDDSPPLSEPALRLASDLAFGPLHHAAEDDAYFEDGLRLLRSIKTEPKVKTVLESYLKYAKRDTLRAAIEKVIRSLEKTKCAKHS